MMMTGSTMSLPRADAGQHAPRDDKPARDVDLMKQVRQRDRRALELLYNRYSSKALGLAYKILRDRDLAEEMVVDAFWRVWQRADQFDLQRGGFATWFYGIVRHLAIDELRRRAVRPTPHDDQQLESALALDVTKNEDVNETVARRLDAVHVQNALKELPPRQREVIHLSYFEGLTREEIAQKLGQPIGTVHTRARLGLGKLRVLLAHLQA